MSLAEQTSQPYEAGSSSNAPRAVQIEDLRFRKLLGEAAWAELPEAVRRRFSKRLGANETVVYCGEVEATRLSGVGRFLSMLARIIGSPLPLADGATGPATVIVSEEPALGGQCWLRIYARPGTFPQVIHSAKRFRGATGLEEYVGFGIGMALRVSVEDGAMVFRSAGYFIGTERRRLFLPKFMQPGEMRIEHRDLGEGRFAFSLELTHRVFGCLVYQRASFVDA